MKYAQKACELTARRLPRLLCTLAAAHAEAGDFALAAKTQQEAIDLQHDSAAAEKLRERLKQYERHEPYHVR